MKSDKSENYLPTVATTLAPAYWENQITVRDSYWNISTDLNKDVHLCPSNKLGKILHKTKHIGSRSATNYWYKQDARRQPYHNTQKPISCKESGKLRTLTHLKKIEAQKIKAPVLNNLPTSWDEIPCDRGTRNGSTMEAHVITTTEGSDEVVVSYRFPCSGQKLPPFSMFMLQGTRKPEADSVVSPDLSTSPNLTCSASQLPLSDICHAQVEIYISCLNIIDCLNLSRYQYFNNADPLNHTWQSYTISISRKLCRICWPNNITAIEVLTRNGKKRAAAFSFLSDPGDIREACMNFTHSSWKDNLQLSRLNKVYDYCAHQNL